MPAWITPLECEVWWARQPVLALEHAEARVRMAAEQLAGDGEPEDAAADRRRCRMLRGCGCGRIIGGDEYARGRLGSGHGAALKPPIKPQLALSRKVLPEGEDWVYEPKYDGFRALAYVDGDEVYLQSRGGKPLRRYFPEVEFPQGRYVLDGELVILDERRARGVRPAPEPAPPGGVAGEDARREDAGAVPGLRPARRDRRSSPEGRSRSGAQALRAS